MDAPVQLSARDARRVAVRAQLLTADRPHDLLETIRHLTFLQVEPTAAVAPSAHVVAWSRLGRSYRPAHLEEALTDGSLLELELRIRPAEDLRLFRAEMAHWPGDLSVEWRAELAEWVRDNDACRRDVLDLLRGDGPLPAAAVPDTCVRPWRSSGWTDDKNVQKLLDQMIGRGEVAVAARERGTRLYDLAERVYPDEPGVPEPEASLERARRRLAALGIARARVTRPPGEPNDVGEIGVEARIDGVRGTWRVDPACLDGAPFRGRTALLSPLDRLVFDRKRMAELFGFDYQLEQYKPVAKRRFGYWAMPVLDGDELVGKLDATTDREGGVLHVDALHEDGDWKAARRRRVATEIRDLAAWLDLEPVGPGLPT